MVASQIAGNQATVRFDQVGAGLVFKPSVDGISGMYMRGKTGEPRWAQVKVVGGDTAEISSPEIGELQTVDHAATFRFSKATGSKRMHMVWPSRGGAS